MLARQQDLPDDPAAARSTAASQGSWTRTRGVVVCIGALVVYLVLAVAVLGRAWQSGGSLSVGQGTDPVFSIWYLRWVPFAISHGVNPFVTDYLDFPAGANLTWSGLFFLPALLLSPVTNVAGPVVAYNAMATLAFASSAWTAFLAIRRYVPSTIGAFAGGLLYGFSPAMMAQSLGHPQIAVAFIAPLILIALDQIVVRQRWHYLASGAVLGLLGAAQLYTGEELLAAEAIVAIVALAFLASAQPHALRSHLPYITRAAAVAAVVFLALAGPSLIIQFFGPQRVTGGALQPPNVFVTDVVNFVLPTSVQAFAPDAAVHLTERASGNLAEWDGYIGVALLGLLIFSAVRYRRILVMRLSATVALLLALLSLGLTIHVAGIITPIPVAVLVFGFWPLRRWFSAKVLTWTFVVLWAGLAVAPILRNLLPARLMLYVFLFAGMLLAAFLNEVVRMPSLRTKALGLTLAGLALLPLVPRLPYPSTELTSPAFFAPEIANQYISPGAVVLVAPYSRGGHTDAMLWQAQSGFVFKMPEGYALIPGPRASPPDSRLGAAMAAIEVGRLGPLDSESLVQMRQELRAWRVQAVIVGPMPHRDDMVRLMTTLLARAPRSVSGVEIW